MFSDFRKQIPETGWIGYKLSILLNQTEEAFKQIKEYIESEHFPDRYHTKLRIAISIYDDRETDLKIPSEYLISIDILYRPYEPKLLKSLNSKFNYQLFLEQEYDFRGHIQRWQRLWLMFVHDMLKNDKKSKTRISVVHDEGHMTILCFEHSVNWFLTSPFFR